MSQLVDEWLEADRELARPAWVVGHPDPGDQGRRSLALARTRPRLMQALLASMPVIGRGLRLALPVVLAVLASQAFDERRRRTGLAIDCPQPDEPEPGGNLSVGVWVTELILSPGLCVSPSEPGDSAGLMVAYRR